MINSFNSKDFHIICEEIIRDFNSRKNVFRIRKTYEQLLNIKNLQLTFYLEKVHKKNNLNCVTKIFLKEKWCKGLQTSFLSKGNIQIKMSFNFFSGFLMNFYRIEEREN